MTIPPIVQLIHASDAPQHTAELKSILGRMKTENRISDFTAIDIGANPDNINFKNEDHQGIIVMLTHEIEQLRNNIEQSLKNLTQEKPNIKLIEIIVDNLPYDNNFISFPQDLMPIRSLVDMNTAWNGIERDLHAIFPKLETKVEKSKSQKPDFKRYLKLAALTVLSFILFIIIFDAAFPVMDPDAENMVGIYWTVVPIMVYLWHRKSLELATLPNQQKERIEGFINWRQFIIRMGIVWLVVFLSYTFWSGSKDEEIVSMLAIISSLPFLLYRTITESGYYIEDQDDDSQSPFKKFFKFIGNVVLSFLLSMAFWWFVLIVFDVDNALFMFLGMTIVTTLGLLVMRHRRKRTRSSS
jgi:hypothetical protein